MRAPSILASVLLLMATSQTNAEAGISPQRCSSAESTPVRPDDPIEWYFKPILSPWGYWGIYKVKVGENDLVCTGTSQHFTHIEE
ncbi:MAG: hypothetical protein V2A76_13235 [Planctomycetota bacterium]